MGKFDKNLFYDNQLSQDSTSWDLIAQPWVKDQTEVKDGNYTDIVLSGIIQDTEFGINISHNFGPPDGIVNEVAGTVRSITDNLTSIGQTMSLGEGAIRDLGYGDQFDARKADLSNEMNKTKFGQVLWSVVNGGSKGSVFFSAFDHIKVYKGSEHNFEFPQLYTRVWHDTAKKSKDKTIGSAEYMNELMSRFVGGVESVESHFDTMLGIQNPPNGYVPSFKNIKRDDPIKGTFQLRYGNHWINNLLVVQASIKASTFKVRTPSTAIEKYLPANLTTNSSEFSSGDQRFVKRKISSGTPGKDDTNCLYIDVSIQVAPCTYVSKEALINALKMRV